MIIVVVVVFVVIYYYYYCYYYWRASGASETLRGNTIEIGDICLFILYVCGHFVL